MTAAVAALVAEAIASADRTISGPVFRAPRYHWISFGPGEPQLEFCRIDVRDAVAHHLATKVVEAEGRAERAEARLRKSLDEVMYAICENALRGEGESAGAVCKRAIEDAAKEAGRG